MTDSKFITGRFIRNNAELTDGPEWGMSLKAAGSTRFRWNEHNENRIDFLSSIADGRQIAQPELIHSHIVFDIDDAEQVKGRQGDGIITLNTNIMPVVTVADCMPVYIYDPVTKVFGMLHSGWKGTGIAVDAVRMACEKHGARAEDFCVVMGPHIHECCYQVMEDRARYFAENFTPECVSKNASGTYDLSLAKANLSVLLKAGVRRENILISDRCTCCNQEFGSFRRETASYGPEVPLEERKFTVQSAWVKWN